MKSLCWYLCELLQTEKELKAEIGRWENENEQHFEIGGCRYLDSIENQWEDLKEEKEKQKEQRVRSMTDKYL